MTSPMATTLHRPDTAATHLLEPRELHGRAWARQAQRRRLVASRHILPRRPRDPPHVVSTLEPIRVSVEAPGGQSAGSACACPGMLAFGVAVLVVCQRRSHRLDAVAPSHWRARMLWRTSESGYSKNGRSVRPFRRMIDRRKGDLIGVIHSAGPHPQSNRNKNS